MSRKKVLVLGGNFGGLTAAITVKHELHGDVDVTVVSSSDEFLFTPSLIWVPFGKRTRADITFKLAPTFEDHQVEFVHAEATAIDPEARRVETTAGQVTTVIALARAIETRGGSFGASGADGPLPLG